MMEALKALAELQQAFDTTSYAFNRRLVRLLICSENDLTAPTKEFDIALERLRDCRTVLNLLETWIVDHSPPA